MVMVMAVAMILFRRYDVPCTSVRNNTIHVAVTEQLCSQVCRFRAIPVIQYGHDVDDGHRRSLGHGLGHGHGRAITMTICAQPVSKALAMAMVMAWPSC